MVQGPSAGTPQAEKPAAAVNNKRTLRSWHTRASNLANRSRPFSQYTPRGARTITRSRPSGRQPRPDADQGI